MGRCGESPQDSSVIHKEDSASEEYKEKSAKEKGSGGKDWGKPGAGFQEPLSVESQRTLLVPQQRTVTARVQCCVQGSSLMLSALGFITGVGHLGSLRLGLPEGLQVCNTDHVCTDEWLSLRAWWEPSPGPGSRAAA